jgi:hypothetical protein
VSLAETGNATQGICLDVLWTNAHLPLLRASHVVEQVWQGEVFASLCRNFKLCTFLVGEVHQYLETVM